MARRAALLLLLPLSVAGACASFDDEGTGEPRPDAGADAVVPGTDGGPERDSGSDGAPGGRCDKTKAFGAPVLVAELNAASANDAKPALTSDELTLVFASDRESVGLHSDLYVTTRASRSDAWGPPSKLVFDNVNTPTLTETHPWISGDGTKLLFARNSGISPGDFDLWSATKGGDGKYGPPAELVATKVLASVEASPYQGSTHIWYAGQYLSSPRHIWSVPIGSTSLSDPRMYDSGARLAVDEEDSPVVTQDELTLYLGRKLDGADAAARFEVYRATRPSTAGEFGGPTVVRELSLFDVDVQPAWLSADECVLYLTVRGTNYDIFVATRPR